MRRWLGKLPRALPWAVLLLGLGLPLGALLVRSVLFHEVVQKDGTVLRAVGDVIETDEGVRFDIQLPGETEKRAWEVDRADLLETRTVWSLDHYGRVFGDARARGLLTNSAYIAFGGALCALLLGLPVAWVLSRTRLRGRALLAALCLGPAVLPPFFMALGGARPMQRLLIDLFHVGGGTLQILNSILVFGCALFPLYVLLVGPALAAVPAGPWESARLLRGPRAAFRHVTLPAILPSIVGAYVLTFVLALTDFAIPDVTGFLLPAGGTPAQVFATEVFLQWKQHGNAGRSVATGAPFVVVTAILLSIGLVLLRRSPVFSAARSHRRRPPHALRLRGTLLAYAVVVGVLLVTLVLPMVSIASWAGSGAESTAGGSTNPTAVDSSGVALFDFSATLDRTTGSRGERDRWILTGVLAALLAMLVAVPLARAATRGGRFARACVLVVGALPLAVPGLVLSVGTLLLWQAIPGTWIRPVEDSVARSVLILSVKFLPFALLAAWLALRGVHRGHEEAAAMLGAGARTRAWRILVPAAAPGVLAGGLVVLVLALRELDSVTLIDPRILPMRLYDKIHFNRMADEANLLFLCQAYLLGPALLAALILGLRRWRRRA